MMLVGGLAFHKYYFDLTSHTDNSVVSNHITMSHPHVRWIGVNSSAVIVGYTRVDLMFVDGKPITKIIPESQRLKNLISLNVDIPLNDEHKIMILISIRQQRSNKLEAR